MFDFNALSADKKEELHQLLLTCANNFGGKNFFLQLLEELRESNSHPLISRHQDFLSEFGTIRWGKVIFNDKIQLIEQIRASKRETANILPLADEKDYKRVLNVIRTLEPMTFSVRPNLREAGEGFDFKAFDTIDEKTIHLNPIFEALFFSSMESVKKVLNHKA